MTGVILLMLTALAPGTPSVCIPVNAEHIAMRDLAGGDARFAVAADSDRMVGFAPQPGAKRVFWPNELAQSAARAGVSAGTEPFAPMCFERQTRALTSAEVLEAIRAWAPSRAEIEVLEQSRLPAPLGALTIPRPAALRNATDGSVTLRGFVRYDAGRKFPIWARVRLSIKSSAVVASETIAAGAEIREDQVRLEERTGGLEAAEFITDLARVTGRTSRKRIAAGEAISPGALIEPEQVKRGALVSVEVKEGAAHLSLEARAETGGRTGDNITVRNPSSGKIFQARVTGENTAQVFPRGSRSQGTN